MLAAAERRVHGALARLPWLKDATVLGYQAALAPLPVHEQLPPVGTVGMAGHFFGFHDKCPWSADGTLLAAHLAPVGGRAALNAAEVRVMDTMSWTSRRVACTRAWNWQQGASLQWVGTTHQLVFNDWEVGVPVSRVVGAGGRTIATHDTQVSHVAPDGSVAVGFSFERLGAGMPEYGYQPASSPAIPGSDRDGLRLLDLRSGHVMVAVSLRELRRSFPLPGSGIDFVSHAVFAPAGRQIAFLYRRAVPSRPLRSALLVWDGDAASLTRIDLQEPSHFCWLPTEGGVVTGRQGARWGYFEWDDSGRTWPLLPEVLTVDGHPHASPDGRWLVTDTYPDRRRLQSLMLVDLVSGAVEVLARLRIPFRFRRGARCDFHPRFSRDGRAVCFDSAHSGERGMYVMALDPAPIAAQHSIPRAEDGASGRGTR